MGEVPARGGAILRFIPARYVLAVLGCVAFAIIYGLKVNLSVAIVGMVNHTATAGKDNSSHHAEGECGSMTDNSTADASHEDGPFLWSTTLQGTILSAYFWGYIVAQLPGGTVAEMFSAKWVMFFSVAINVVCTLLTPIMAELHYGALLVMRIGEGIGGGVTFPAMHVLLAHWAPPTERSVMSSIVYAGTALGTVISMLISGIIAGGLGWEQVFYIQGGLSILWLIGWVFLTADTPEQQALISQEERDFIVNALNDEGALSKGKHPPVPWKSVFTSLPFYAILIAHTCSNWGWYMVLIELPTYMKSVLGFKISQNALMTGLPFLSMWVFSLFLSKRLDALRAKNTISTTFARKVGTLIACLVPMACFLVLSYIGCERGVAVMLMTLAVTAVGGMFSGFLSNHIDIAPNFAGTLMAITNTVATIPGIIVPIFVGKLTEKDPSITSWRTIFWVTIILYAIEALFYVLFASGVEQEWNKSGVDTSVEGQPLKSPVSPNDLEKQNYDATATSTLEAK